MLKVQKSDILIANSMHTKEKVIQYFNVDPRKIAVIYESYDDEIFSIQRGRKKDTEVLFKYGVKSPFIFYVSSFRPYKNHYDLLMAFQLLSNRFEHKLILIGNDVDGYKSTVLEIISSLGLSDRVIILDYIHHWELAAFYRKADAFVYPSKLETFGIPPIEAMACGCPVITSNYSCIPEIVGDGAEIVDTSNHVFFFGNNSFSSDR